ncbi:hypothetical protein ACGFIY_21130 [Micromonospora chersina]|uniref:hypothetical protein n=1 Tax=Micromonospora chersina TaxID=47854 RepID=UPI00371D93FA
MTAATLPIFVAEPQIPQTWTLTVTSDQPFLTANIRGGAHWVKTKVTSAWREATYLTALAHKPVLPKGLQRVRIDVVLRFNSNRHRDLSNYTDAAKPAVDALGPPFVRTGKKAAAAPGYGLIPDDGIKNLDGPHVRFGATVPAKHRAELMLYITDLTNVPAHRTWTPTLPSADGGTTVRAKRYCNGCGNPVGDALEAEVIAAMEGRRLPDVTGECSTCVAVVR